MKIDCSITKNFLIERNRLCKSQSGCMSCPFYLCSHGSSMCIITEEKIDDAIKIVQMWSDKNQPEIDWTKVPIDTPVLVKDENEIEWKKCYFAIYLPQATAKFRVFTNRDTRENAKGVCYWDECKLADDVDPTPFYKSKEE